MTRELILVHVTMVAESTLRPSFVRFTGEVTDLRITPEAGYTRYVRSGYGPRSSFYPKQVGAMTVRVKGKPVTCLVDMYTRFIGVMPGNTVTIYGRVRKWDAGSDVPDSVDVDRLSCEETGEVHPQRSWGGAAGAWAIVIPILSVVIFIGFFFAFFIFGPIGGGSLLVFPILPVIFPLMFIMMIFVALIPLIVRGARLAKGSMPRPEDEYVQVPGYSLEASETVEKAYQATTVSTCVRCGVEIKNLGAIFCSNCGARIESDIIPTKKGTGKCIVCNLAVRKSDAVVFCPHCGNVAHREHMLEWLKVKDRCPACGKHLDEMSF